MPQQLGPYQLKERLGVGGMAEVFLAHARRKGDFVQPCVVKVLHRELADDQNFTRMLLEEARLIAHLRHNNIASLYDVGRDDGNVFLVMEYIQGRDLHDILAHSSKAGRDLPIAFALHVARYICAGLHFAHTRKSQNGSPLDLIHRDISPPNVLISALGEVKVIDFGVAKFNSEAREKTKSGVIKGKFGYMSPEQAWDEELDRRSDIFSVGICLYEMLTGRSLYGQSDDAMDMLKRAREADIEPVTQWRDDVPETLERIVHKALAQRRDDRYQSAHSMERELVSVLSRISPDYTNLDAGAVLDELFDIEDPALKSRSPRLDTPVSPSEASSPPPAVSGPGRGVAESTQPMTDVPDEVRKSGAHRRNQASASAPENVPEDATKNITFDESELSDGPVPDEDADFSAEKTELFDEQRVSGAHSAIDADTGARQRTQLIDTDDADQQAPPSAPLSLNDEPTDPARATADELTERRTFSDNDLPPICGTNAFDDSDINDHDEAPTRDMRQRVKPQDLDGPDRSRSPREEPRTPNSVVQTSKQKAVDDMTPQSATPGSGPIAPASADVTVKKDENEGIDRRLQLAGAAAFVLLALLFVVSRIF